MRNPGGVVDGLRERIEAGERGGCDRDCELLIEFSNELRFLREEYSDQRHEKLLRHMTIVSENAGPLEPLLEDPEAVKDTVRWIHREYDNPETNRDYRVALRVFGKRVTEGDDVPDSVDIVSSKTPRNYNPTPKSTDLFEWETDIQPMLEACQNPRDKAAIALQMDAGLRGESELYGLGRGDIISQPNALHVVVDGKTGEREVPLVPSTPHVSRWLDEHPSSKSDAPLWCGLRDADQLSYQGYLKMFKEPARRADIDKRVTPTILRKSNATWLARMGANAALIEDRQGRERGSDAVARYVARFSGQDAETAYRALHGEDVEEETPDDHAPIECPRCDRDTPADRDRCMWCGQAISPTGGQIAEEQDGRMMQAIASDPELADAVMALKQRTEDMPGIRLVLDE